MRLVSEMEIKREFWTSYKKGFCFLRINRSYLAAENWSLLMAHSRKRNDGKGDEFILFFSLPFCSYRNILKDLSFSRILLYQIITSHYHLSDVSYISFCTINQQKNQLSHTHMGFANNILLKLRKTLFCLLKSVQRFQEQMESRETSWTARDGPLLTSKWNKSNWIYQLFHYMFVL